MHRSPRKALNNFWMAFGRSDSHNISIVINLVCSGIITLHMISLYRWSYFSGHP